MNFNLSKFSDHDREKLGFLPPHLLNLIEYHRGLDDLDPDQADKYYLYTGRGPSGGSFHIGHLPGLSLILELYQRFNAEKIFFMISDDEKTFRDNIHHDIMCKNVELTIHQLQSLGFSNENTNYHINSRGISSDHYSIMIELLSRVNINQINHIFGTKDKIGEYFYPMHQIMPCFLNREKQCIIVAGKDQDPFFRLARDLAERMGYKKPIIIYTKSVPGFDGSEKMSTSNSDSLPVYLDDTVDIIREKVSKIKKVGAGTLDELFQNGANLDNDVPFQIIKMFERCQSHVQLVAESYTHGLNENDHRIHQLRSIINERGLVTRDGRTMLTSSGIRIYLCNLLCRMTEKLNI
jgi:tryptophanyl-tRNA synthetase